MATNPRLSVIVPTRNEAANVAACLAAFDDLRQSGVVETIVVDNDSTDDTCALAEAAGARVFRQGPERSAQRNRGAKEARAPFLMFLDADMVVPAGTTDEILSLIAADSVDALYVREVRTGTGLRTKARNFERGFYDATCIDAVRVVRKSVFDRSGGFDETLTSAEDWDLDRRLPVSQARVRLTDGHLLHNEKRLSLKRVLEKKAYYSQWFARYQDKWRHDAIVKKQFGFRYRFIGVFVENGKWKRVLRHPILFSVMMLERILVGFVYLASRRRRRPPQKKSSDFEKSFESPLTDRRQK